MMSSELVWLITGTSYVDWHPREHPASLNVFGSSGLGHTLSLAALARGDKVIATTRARSFPQIEGLKTAGAAILELDVTATLDELESIAGKAIAIYGRVDVVVNNAGYLANGALEECTYVYYFTPLPLANAEMQT